MRKENEQPLIQIIDDSSTNIMLLQGILEEKGLQSEIFMNAEDGLAFLKDNTPDLIVLDIMMPKMDGYSFLEEMQKMEGKSEIPVIIVSAKTEDDDIKKAKVLGAVEYITKPLRIESFIQKIESLIHIHS